MNRLKKMALRVIAKLLSEDEIAGLKQLFKMIDTYNSGQITFEELKTGLKRLGANLEESEIYNLMQADPHIDYTVVVTMMQKGNPIAAVTRGVETSFSINFREALKET